MQKGFILPSLYIYLGLGAVILFLGLAVKVQSSRLESCKAEFQSFKSEVERLGNEAKVKADLINKKNLKLKDKADAELKELRAANADLNKRVFDNSRSSFVSRESPSTGIPETACFDTEKLDGAIKRFAERVTGITEQGQSAVDELNNARAWASQ